MYKYEILIIEPKDLRFGIESTEDIDLKDTKIDFKTICMSNMIVYEDISNGFIKILKSRYWNKTLKIIYN